MPAPPLPSLSSPAPLTNPSFPPGSTPATQPGDEAKSEAPRDPSIAGVIVPDTTPERYAIGIASAINKAQTERWGEQPNPVVWSNGHTVALRDKLMGAGVPIELARTTIGAVVRKHKGAPFTNAAYFEKPILDAWDAERQKRHDRTADAPGQSPAEVRADREREAQKLRDPSTCDGHRKGGTCRAQVYRFRRPSAAKKYAKLPEAERPTVSAIVDCSVAGGLEPADNREGRGVSHFKTCPDVGLFSGRR